MLNCGRYSSGNKFNVSRLIESILWSRSKCYQFAIENLIFVISKTLSTQRWMEYGSCSVCSKNWFQFVGVSVVWKVNFYSYDSCQHTEHATPSILIFWFSGTERDENRIHLHANIIFWISNLVSFIFWKFWYRGNNFCWCFNSPSKIMTKGYRQ